MKSDEEIQERLKGKEQIGKMIEEEKKMKTGRKFGRLFWYKS